MYKELTSEVQSTDKSGFITIMLFFWNF